MQFKDLSLKVLNMMVTPKPLMQLKQFFCLHESNQNAKDFVSQPFHMGINRVFLYDLERDNAFKTVGLLIPESTEAL